MKLRNFLLNNKLMMLNIVLCLYVLTNFIGGERGIVSYFEKNKLLVGLNKEKAVLIEDLKVLQNKNRLLSEKIDLDYIDILYREKFKVGKKDEILIKLK